VFWLFFFFTVEQLITVLLAQRFVGPPKDLTLFLGAGHKHSIGIVWELVLLKRDGFTAKAQQAPSHVTNVWMRLMIHLPHIVVGVLFRTKQHTGVHGTFDIFPSVLGLVLLQTNLMARAPCSQLDWQWVSGSKGFEKW